MDISRVPVWVTKQLLDGEVIIAHFTLSDFELYATNKRLLRFTGKGRKDCQEIEYSTINISIKKYGTGMLLKRIIVIIFSSLVIWVGIVGRGYGRGEIPPVLANVFIVLAICMIIFVTVGAYLMGNSYYQIQVPGLSIKELKKWRIARTRWGNKQTEEYIKAIGDASGKDIV